MGHSLILKSFFTIVTNHQHESHKINRLNGIKFEIFTLKLKYYYFDIRYIINDTQVYKYCKEIEFIL
jgi:hypothetical protein